MTAGGGHLVGRERELEELDTFLRRPAPTPAALLIEGVPGIGKTALWEAALGRLDRPRILRCGPAESEAQHAFGVVGDLLAAIDRPVLDALPTPQRRALGAAVLRESDDLGPDPRTVALGFLAVMRALAAERPLVIALDDCQWVDPSSAGLLAFTLRRLDREPITLLLTRRRSDAPPPFELDRALGDDLRRLAVGPLTLGGTHRLLRQRFGHPFPRPLLRRIHEASGGTPLYSIEIARALEARGAVEPGAPVAVPPSLGAAIRDRLAAQPSAVRRALATAAAAARPTAFLVGDDAALDLAVAANLVTLKADRVRFTHPLLASAAYDAIGAEGRRAVHHRLAAVNEDPEERARHLALASTDPDEDIAATVEEAAERAARRGATEEAAELAQLALRLTPASGTEAAARRRLRGADLLLSLSDYEGVRAVLAGDVAPEALVRVLETYEGVDTLALVDAVLAAEGAGDLVRAAALRARGAERISAGAVAEARDDARAAVEAAELAGNAALLAESRALMGLAAAVMGEPPADSWWQKVVAHERNLDTPLFDGPLQVLGMLLMWRDRLEEARAALEEVDDRARVHGNHSYRTASLMHLTELECRAGRFRAAMQHALTMVDISGHTDAEQTHALVLYGLSLAEAHLGRLDDADRHAREGITTSEAVGDRIFLIQNQAVRGFVALSRGDMAEAARILPPLWDELAASGYREPSIYPVLPNAIEALASTGALAEARQRAATLLELGHSLDSPWALALGTRGEALVLLADGDTDAARERLEVALELHERLPSPFERARTLLTLGRLERRAKRRGRARDVLEEAIALFERTEASVWEAKAREELSRVSGRGRAGGELTATEQRVAELVGEGRSNKEVAGELFVSVRTVETNLTRVYAKLGIRNRAELARRRGNH